MRVVLMVILTLVLAGQSASPAAGAAPGDRLSVVTSFYPLFEFSRQVGGDRVTVRNLVPAGAEPHDYEPTPRDVIAMYEAHLVVYNGAGLEPWVRRLLPQIPDRVIKVNASEGLPIVTATAGEDRGRPDPHVWLDPVLAQRQVDLILAGLVKADPAGRQAYEAGASAYKTKLAALHERIAQSLAPCRKRVFVVSHAAFGYFAARYGLTQIAISGLEPQEEPSPAKIREVLRLVRQYGVSVIYHETLASTRVAAALAREAGARSLVLNPLEGLTPEEQRQGKDYLSIMGENVSNLRQGLDCPN